MSDERRIFSIDIEDKTIEFFTDVADFEFSDIAASLNDFKALKPTITSLTVLNITDNFRQLFKECLSLKGYMLADLFEDTARTKLVSTHLVWKPNE